MTELHGGEAGGAVLAPIGCEPCVQMAVPRIVITKPPQVVHSGPHFINPGGAQNADHMAGYSKPGGEARVKGMRMKMEHGVLAPGGRGRLFTVLGPPSQNPTDQGC